MAPKPKVAKDLQVGDTILATKKIVYIGRYADGRVELQWDDGTKQSLKSGDALPAVTDAVLDANTGLPL